MTPTIEHCKLWFADPANARKFFGNFDIQENGCQLWRGPFFDGGHGLYTFDGAHVRVHRLRWILRRGVDVPDDICIRHWACENKPCGNTRHLIGGDWIDNREDQVWLNGRFCVPMAFGPGHDTGGEPGSLRRTIRGGQNAQCASQNPNRRENGP